jgi:hypothetical protein
MRTVFATFTYRIIISGLQTKIGFFVCLPTKSNEERNVQYTHLSSTVVFTGTRMTDSSFQNSVGAIIDTVSG